MNRNEAWDLLKQNLSDEHLIHHSLAVEAVMAGMAKHLGEDEEKWALAGLLHDIDYEETKEDLERHSLVGAEMLIKAGLPADIAYAVKVHNEAHGLPRVSVMDKALFAIDPVTGLITAAALVNPEKSLQAVKVKSLKKKFKEKSFARGANRDNIATCTELGLTLEEFLTISLEAMQGIGADLGLA